MAQLLEKTKAELGQSVVLLLPLGLWGMIWLGIQPGSVRDVINPGSFTEFLHGLRAASPFVAAGAAALYMLVRIPKRDKRRLFFFGPLALAAVYGLVGIAASLRSPETSTALYWASLYLTVPLILWVATLSPDPLRQVERIIQFNWLVIGLGFAALFALGLISLDLGQSLLNPSDLLRCQQLGSWFEQSSGALRSTGVGRFAAITGIISLSLVWKGNLRAIWGVVFLASLALLLFTGARGSAVPFVAAVPVVFWLMGGKTAKIGAGVGLVIFASVMLSTGTGADFFSKCLLTETTASQIDYLELRSPTQFFGQDSSSQTPQATEPGSRQEQPEAGARQEQAVPASRQEQPEAGGRQEQAAPASRQEQPVAGSRQEQAVPASRQEQPEAGARQEQAVPASRQEQPVAGSRQEQAVPASRQEQAKPASGQEQAAPASGQEQAKPASGQEQAAPASRQEQAKPGSRQEKAVPVLGQEQAAPASRQEQAVPASRQEQAKPGSRQEKAVPVLGQEQAVPTNVEDDSSASGFYTASGRTQIWAAGWKFIRLSPVLGYGFHADRLVLGTHMHNAVLHAMIQTGLLGTIPFVGAILWAWFLLIITLRKLNRLAPMRKTAVIQAAGILVFLSFRALPESTGAFFGIDWILLGPLLLYLHLVNSADVTREEGA